jgi:S-adenosylmethionine hydrolase
MPTFEAPKSNKSKRVMSTIITLISDYGTRDHFAGAFKGLLLSQNSDLKVFDISHQVKAFSLTEAAYMARNAYRFYPKGSVHIILVESGEGQPQRPLAMALDDHYFIGIDNGVLPLIRPDLVPESVVDISMRHHQNLETNWETFAKAAAFLATGGQIGVLGHAISDAKKIITPRASISSDGKSIMGNVVYIDNFGNLVTNISKTLFQETGQGRPYTIRLPRNKAIKNLVSNYQDAPYAGYFGAFFNAGGFLEVFVSLSGGELPGAAGLLGIRVDETVNIYFE